MLVGAGHDEGNDGTEMVQFGAGCLEVYFVVLFLMFGNLLPDLNFLAGLKDVFFYFDLGLDVGIEFEERQCYRFLGENDGVVGCS